MATRRNRPQPAPYTAASDERHREAGETQRKVWAHPDDWPAIRELEKKLREARKKTCLSAKTLLH